MLYPLNYEATPLWSILGPISRLSDRMAARRTYGAGSLLERPTGSGRRRFRLIEGAGPITANSLHRSVTIKAKSNTAA
jgi:hypothetical protein